jgi:hypothetical protein
MITGLIIGAAIGAGFAARHFWPWQPAPVIVERPVYVERVVEPAPTEKK